MKSKPSPSVEMPRGAHAPFLPSRIRIRLTGRLLWRGGAALGLLLVVLGCVHRLAGRSGPKTLPNVPVPTAGGQQLWADVAWDAGWRVQTHVWTGHARLLDDQDIRRAWGAREACEQALQDRRARGDFDAPGERAVVILHGLWRTRDAMERLSEAFNAAGYDVIDIACPALSPSTVSRHARSRPVSRMSLQRRLSHSG